MQLAMHRLTAVERLRVGHFALYEITEQTPPPAYWRVCREAGGGASHWPIVDVPVEERSRLCTERARP